MPGKQALRAKRPDVAGLPLALALPAVLLLQLLAPALWPWLRGASLAAGLQRRGRRRAGYGCAAASAPAAAGPLARLLALPVLLLEPLAGAAAASLVLPPVLRQLHAPLYRTLLFYARLTPVALGYARTVLRDSTRAAGPAERQLVWDARHERGAAAVRAALLELGGFYPKVGQVFASKADILPAAYTRSLRSLFDACAPAPFEAIARTLREQLGAERAGALLARMERQPVATATVAQVYRAAGGGGAPGSPPLAVKVQRPGAERTMRGDMATMLFAARACRWLRLDLNVDQVSILREYQKQVPLEFDFVRERRLMVSLGASLAAALPGLRLRCCRPVPSLCASRVLTMEFMDGVPYSELARRLDAWRAAGGGGGGGGGGGVGAQPGAAAAAAAAQQLPPCPAGCSPAEVSAAAGVLLTALGHMIFVLGTFHSDPHAGNLLLCPDGCLGLLDFGEAKALADGPRLGLARLTLALARRDGAAAGAQLASLGLVLTGASPAFAGVAATILFDTRMDLPEARTSPLDAGPAGGEMRAARLQTLPEDLFMVVRVCALVRGLLATFGADACAADIWAPFARAALLAAGEEEEAPAVAGPASGAARGGATAAASPAAAPLEPLHARVEALARWLAARGLAADAASLAPCVLGGVTSVADLAACDDARLAAALAAFPPSQRAGARDAARAEAAGA